MKLLRVVFLLLLLLPTTSWAAGPTSPTPLEPLWPVRAPAPGAGVQIVGGDYAYLYVVQGAPQAVRGMGYNAPLSALTLAQRLQRMYVDFALMRRTGVNTLIGWDQAGFDHALLDVAQANALGVVMHFELGKDWDYGDAALRARVLDEIGEWVDQYRDHPAVRMWGVGNEVMLTMDPEDARRFAGFYVDVYRTVRQHDELHPVVYREAEDVRAPLFKEAFEAAGVKPDGFVFGMNFYTPRVGEALDAWPSLGFDVPVLISELAPAGVPPSARAAAFGDLWSRLRRHEQFVVGAAPYAWTIDGPEAVDRIFGLTDGHGHPVDPALSALQRIFRGGAARGELLPAPMPPPLPPGLALEAAFAQALARALALAELEPIDLDSVRVESRRRYAAELAGAPGAPAGDQGRMARMLDLLAETSVLAALRVEGRPAYPGAVEALPLVAGMARWAAGDPGAEAIAAAFLTEVINQALSAPIGATPTPE